VDTINIKRFGFAVGSTFALLYLGCVVVVMTAGKESLIFLFNTLFHGLDVTSIIRISMPWYNMVIGLVEFFILGWLIGATIASMYNIGQKINPKTKF